MTRSFNWTKIAYTNAKGLKLAGLLYNGPETDTVIVVCHGFTGKKEGSGKAVAMAEELGKRGYATLLFDFSGCGESEGKFSDLSLTGHIDDIKSSVDYCLELGFERVVTVGRSFGGSAALCHGGSDLRVAGVCTWAAPAELVKLFSVYDDPAVTNEGNLVPLSGEEGTAYLKKSFFSDLERHDVPAQAALIAPRPLLVIHGNNDEVVPPGNAQKIFNAASPPKKINYIPGADHRFTGQHEKVWQVFFNWLEEYLPL